MADSNSSKEIAAGFSRIARDYCKLIDSAPSRDKSQLLTELYLILPNLVGEAIRLPKIELDDNEDSGSLEGYPDKADGFPKLYKLLKEKLRSDDIYSTVFDPTKKDAEAIHGSLADDIADIYLDLKEGLVLIEKKPSLRERAMWNWRLLFYSHWGDHAISALRTIHSLLDETLE